MLKGIPHSAHIFISLLYCIVIFGPHAFFNGFGQEFALVLLSLLYLIFFRITFFDLIALGSLSILFIIKAIDLSLSASIEPLILLALLKLPITYLSASLIVRYRPPYPAHLLLLTLIFSVANSLTIILQFFIPPLRTFFRSEVGQIDEWIIRYQGMAFDGFQIPPIVSLGFLLLAFLALSTPSFITSNSPKLIKFIRLFTLLSFLLLPFATIFQGRLASLLLLLSYSLFFLVWPVFAYFFARHKFISLLKYPFFFLIFASLLLSIFSETFSSYIYYTAPLKHGLQLFTTPLSEIGSINDIVYNHAHIFDYWHDFIRILFGWPSSGRPSIDLQFYFPRVPFDNGYYLDLYSYGVVGISLIALAFVNIFRHVLKHSVSLFILLLLLIIHFKEAALFSGSSLTAITLLASLQNHMITNPKLHPRSIHD